MFSVVAYSFDWHPSDHCSFVDNVSLYPLHSSSQVTAEKAKVFDVVVYDKIPIIDQVLWPRHCVMNSWGAELHKDLTVREIKLVVTWVYLIEWPSRTSTWPKFVTLFERKKFFYLGCFPKVKTWWPYSSFRK